jgi:Zn-dependent membrane protease YugP
MIEINTPAILFPAISLLMLAYTNRYLALASLIRKLHSDYVAGHEPEVRAQIENLRFRMRLIRQMQALGMISLLFCLGSVILVLAGLVRTGTGFFAIALFFMAASIVQCLREIIRSGGALDILLRQMETAEAQYEQNQRGKS